MKINLEISDKTYVMHKCDDVQRHGNWLVAKCNICPGYEKKFNYVDRIIKTIDPNNTLLDNITHYVEFCQPGLDLETNSLN